jgi:hypothetical protein
MAFLVMDLRSWVLRMGRLGPRQRHAGIYASLRGSALRFEIFGVWVPTILIENFLCRLAEEFIVDSSWFIEDSSLGKARDLRYAPACAFD